MPIKSKPAAAAKPGAKAIVPTPEQLDSLLNRGVADIIVREQLEARLKKGERLTLYNGVDPTGADLHLGHAIILRKMRQFQDLGHEVILLIGDFTAQIGDPTGKTTARVPLTHEQVLANAKDYQKQAAGILDFKGKNPVKIRFNSEWLAKLTFKEVVQLSMQFTVQQMIERDMFQDRIKNSQPIGLHEFLYPLMQGYDSAAMDVDLELGGNDQLFNMLAGRTLMKSLKNKDKYVLTTPLLEGLDGRKMSKSYNNYVAITAAPDDMYGKLMSMKDELITKYFEICTEVPLPEIKKMAAEMKAGANPRDFKMKLAHAIVAMYHSPKAADDAKQHFLNVFQKHELPTDIKTIPFPKGEVTIKNLLTGTATVESGSEAVRVVKEGGVKINGQTVTDPFAKVSIGKVATLLQKGKLHYLKVIGRSEDDLGKAPRKSLANR